MSNAAALTHRAPPAVLALLAALSAPAFFGVSDLARAEVRVEARLSAQELSSPEPVELTLSAVSGDGSVGNPDLSVLEPDFQVLDRRVERRVSVTNGMRREEVRLRLILLPSRSGELEVPGIPFGSARTQPLRLSVKGDSKGLAIHPEPPAVPSVSLLDPGVFEPPTLAAPGPYAPGYYPDWTSGLLASPSPLQVPLVPPTTAPRADAVPLRGPDQTPLASPRAPPEPAEDAVGTFANPWFWISLVLAAILAGVLGRRRGAGSTRRADQVPGAAAEAAVAPDPLESAVETVRAAYQRGDGRGAREALLNWGRLRWPQDPPGNLARLAGRCPPPLRGHITDLEKAFFSPDPIHWERDPVPDELLAQLPPRVQGVAAA